MLEKTSWEQVVETNWKAWDVFGKKEFFFGTAALPCVGPFGARVPYHKLFDTSGVQCWPPNDGIEGKTFFEIGCGTGHSIAELVSKGAKHVVGLDFSVEQLQHARCLNAEAEDKGKVTFVQKSMECGVMLPNPVRHGVDVVFSLYAMGWSPDLRAVLENANRYLIQGGRLVISWEHPMFAAIRYATPRHFEKGIYVLEKSGHDESPYKSSDDHKRSVSFTLYHRKISTWVQSLVAAGFVVENMFEPEPVDAREGSEELDVYYSLEKAKMVPATIVFVCRKK